MADIATVFAGRPGPYEKGLLVQVVASSSPVTYKGKDCQAKELLVSAVSDGNEVITVACYDPSKFKYFKVNKTVMIKNFIKKVEDGRSIVVTAPSKVVNWTPLTVDIPQTHKTTGELLLCPPPAEILPIADALKSPKKQKVSLSGRLVQEEETKMVKVNGQDVNIKNIIVQDATGQAKVTLWRDTTEVDVRPGDFVQITNVITNTYMETTSFSTTMKSIVKKIDAPVVQETVDVVGISIDKNNNAELYLDSQGSSKTNNMITVPAHKLMEALQNVTSIHDLEDVCSNGPLSIMITTKGSEIVSVQNPV